MKKTLLITAIWTIAVIRLFAQDKQQPVPASFARDFAHATNVRCTKKSNVSIVRFFNAGLYWMVFYSPEGELIAKARHVEDTTALPMNVSSALSRFCKNESAKHGTITIGYSYELFHQGSTKYFFPLETRSHAISLMIDGYGQITSRDRVRKTTPPATSSPKEPAIARQQR